MKALVGAFNQEKALVGAFSVIVQPVVEPMEHYTALVGTPPLYHYQLLCRSEGSDRYTIIIIISAGSGNQEQPGATFVTFVYLHKDG